MIQLLWLCGVAPKKAGSATGTYPSDEWREPMPHTAGWRDKERTRVTAWEASSSSASQSAAAADRSVGPRSWSILVGGDGKSITGCGSGSPWVSRISANRGPVMRKFGASSCAVAAIVACRCR
jgi:hypothetical protein